MREKLEALLKEGAEKIAASQSENELQEIKVQLLGKKGAVTELLKEIPKLDVSLRPEMGKAVMTACKAGCIGCTKCSKVCPEGAITMENNLAVVDPEKCTGCGTCVDACPTKCMTRL